LGGGLNSGAVITWGGNDLWWSLRDPVRLQGPITVVPYYEPIWAEKPMPPRLGGFRAVMNPRQKRLVQHRLSLEGEVVREQIGQRLAGYLYRDTNGVLAKSGSSATSRFMMGPSIENYRALSADFDPATPPANHGTLASTTVAFFAEKADTTLATQDSTIPTNWSTDAQAPFVPAYLGLPSAVRLRTFGHSLRSAEAPQSGGRFRNYLGKGTSYGVASSVAVDGRSGVTFYTQAQEPLNPEANALRETEHTTPPLVGFGKPPDPKASAKRGSVWIVMVY
jgi:hypothetical protein